MFEILAEHEARYRGMRAQDYIKLLYQSEFGGGHLIADRGMALKRLEDEIGAQDGAPAVAYERIGGGLGRLYLPAAGLSAETVLGLFLETCRPRGTMEGMLEKLRLLEGVRPELKGEIDAYIAKGCPMLSHSPEYRAAYAPAYRLVPESAERFMPLFQTIDRLLSENDFVRVAVDGRCAAGKSTLGALLERVYGANLFHMDDYFLPFERKTAERLSEPGGNVDYERAYDEIVSRPRNAQIVWRAFDCGEQCLSEPVVTAPKRLTVVEGSYAMHPKLREGYDLKVFLDIGAEAQSERIMKRNGPEMHARFVNEWIPLENEYFDGLNVRESADLAFDC